MNGTINVVHYPTGKSYRLSVNAYWVSLAKDGRSLFKREPNNESWFDPKHRAITDALDQLTKACFAALNID